MAGAIEAAWFLGFSFFLGALRAGYDPTSDAISRLGEQGSASPLVWNVGGFGVSAVLYAVYALGIADKFGAGWLSFATFLQAVTLAGSAAFSCDNGCPPMATSTMGTLHTVFGLPYFATTCLIPFVAAWTFRRRDAWRSEVRVALAVGTVLVVLFFVGPMIGADRVGLWQRVVLVPALAWQAWISVRLYRSAALILETAPAP